MLLFSKRHKGEFNISNSLLNRVLVQTRHCISAGYFDPRVMKSGRLNHEVFSKISQGDLGYDLTELMDVTVFSLIPESQNQVFDIVELFDIIEYLLIFCLSEKRDDYIMRLMEAFEEEKSGFIIHSHLIVYGAANNLESVTPLIKDKNLKKKLESYFNSTKGEVDYLYLAKVSADILQLILSSDSSQKDTKSFSTDLCLQVARVSVPEDKIMEFSTALNGFAKQAKDFNNQTYDIRHTDRFCMPTKTPNIYRYAASSNIALIELIISSLPDQFISPENPEEIKNGILIKYGIELLREDNLDLGDLFGEVQVKVSESIETF